MKTNTTLLEAAKIARYYRNRYAEAEESDILDTSCFATLDEQRAYFARLVSQYRHALVGELVALRVLYTEQLRIAESTEKPAIEAQIVLLEKELKSCRRRFHLSE